MEREWSAANRRPVRTDEHRAWPCDSTARGYEADPERRRDLLQEIHLELWRSMALFDGRCALRTWVYRVAHNVAASHIVRERRAAARLVDLEALDMEPAPAMRRRRRASGTPRRSFSALFIGCGRSIARLFCCISKAKPRRRLRK